MPSKLNYSKWDKLELSDDSDIEGHPNVDKKSLIRLKQRDIHEKREARKLRMMELSGEVETTNILLPRIRTLISAIDTNGNKEFSTLMERLKTSPSDVGPVPPPGAPKAPSYDEMILQLLYKVWGDVREQTSFDIKDERKTGEQLVSELKVHEENLVQRLEECKSELAILEKEIKEKITSDDIHDGWESHFVPRHEEEPELAPTKPIPKPKAKQKVQETVIETLNAPKTLDTHATDPVAVPPEDSGYVEDDEDDDGDDDEDLVPDLTPSLAAFAKIPPRDFESSLHFLQKDKGPLKPGSMDALLVAAFSAELRGNSKYAKGAVHQALLLEYCEKLGRDGITQFFKRMMSGNPAPQKAFMDDVDRMYTGIKERAAKARQEQNEGRETIQLAVQDPDSTTVISFNIPDGPPPPEDKELKIEWDGDDGGEIDVEQVRAWLKRRWEIWQGFSKKLRRALKTKELEKVNDVLGDMSVEEAEKVVGELQEAGILSFVEGGVRDETPAGLAAKAAEEASFGSQAVTLVDPEALLNEITYQK